MREKLLSALHFMQQQNGDSSRREQLQKQVDDHLLQIEECKTKFRRAQEHTSNPLRKKAIWLCAPSLTCLSIIVICESFSNKFLPGLLNDIPKLNTILLVLKIVFSLGSIPVIPVIITDIVNKNICQTAPQKLQELEQGDLYRQRLIWLAEIEWFDRQNRDQPSLNADTIAFLPESCRSVQAVTFMISCLDSGYVDSIPAAAYAWELTLENQTLQSQLESIQIQNSDKKHQLLKKLDTSSNGMAGFIIWDSILDSFFN